MKKLRKLEKGRERKEVEKISSKTNDMFETVLRCASEKIFARLFQTRRKKVLKLISKMFIL